MPPKATTTSHKDLEESLQAATQQFEDGLANNNNRLEQLNTALVETNNRLEEVNTKLDTQQQQQQQQLAATATSITDSLKSFFSRNTQISLDHPYNANSSSRHHPHHYSSFYRGIPSYSVRFRRYQ
jgi:uncharacterized protein involved in exopolysaccharide biosynthesis